KAGLVAQAPAIIPAGSRAPWRAAALDNKPSGVEPGEWLRACTVRALAAGAPRELAYPLLEALLDDAAARGVAVNQQLAALDDAMLLCSELRDGYAMRIGVPSRYAQLGIRSADEHGLPAWSTIRHHYL